MTSSCMLKPPQPMKYLEPPSVYHRSAACFAVALKPAEIATYRLASCGAGSG